MSSTLLTTLILAYFIGGGILSFLYGLGVI